jgi:hypothetical protein
MTLTINDQSAVQLSVRPVLPAWLTSWWSTYAGACRTTHDAGDVMDMALKTRPRLIVLDGCGVPAWTTEVLDVCRRLKRDGFTGIVPVFVIVPSEAFAAAFGRGAGATGGHAAAQRPRYRCAPVNPASRGP